VVGAVRVAEHHQGSAGELCNPVGRFPQALFGEATVPIARCEDASHEVGGGQKTDRYSRSRSGDRTAQSSSEQGEEGERTIQVETAKRRCTPLVCRTRGLGGQRLEPIDGEPDFARLSLEQCPTGVARPSEPGLSAGSPPERQRRSVVLRDQPGAAGP